MEGIKNDLLSFPYDCFDAYLYLGPQDSLMGSRTDPVLLEDESYLIEMNRRAMLFMGKPFDNEFMLKTKDKTKFFDIILWNIEEHITKKKQKL